MAIARITSGKNELGGGNNSNTLAINTSGSSDVTVVALVEDRNSSGNTSTPQYNGVNMTEINSEIEIAGPRYYRAWYRIVGAGVNANVTVTRTGTTSDFNVYAAAYSGTKQSGFPDASATGELTQADFSQSITTIAENCWLVALHGSQGETLTAGAGTTVVQGGAGNDGTILDSNGSRSAGSNSLAATHNSENYAYWIFSIAPKVEETGNAFFMGANF